MKGTLCTWPTQGPELPAKNSHQRSSNILTWTGHAPLRTQKWELLSFTVESVSLCGEADLISSAEKG